EHEGSYKSGSSPRYHARQIAMKRCGTHKARLVMGSATPSIEAWHLMEEKKLTAVSLPERHSGGGMPELSIVNMNREKGPLSRKLLAEMKTTFDEGRQTILFLNRRGFSYFFHCRSCGYEMRCRQCSITMTYHKNKNRMICHYCGYNTLPVQVCPECSSLDIGYAGFGTEQIEEELTKNFPYMNIQRVDADSTRKKDSLRDKLSQFREGLIHVLVGTQMVAKGLNFPKVKLAGIILADTTLSLPDFRSSERTFSLLVQVAGRAGRYLPEGRVIIQTYRPEHPAIQYAQRNDLDGFFRQELLIRKSLSFPPYTRLFRIVFRGKRKDAAETAAQNFSERLGPARQPGTEVLGPAECPIQTIAGNHRFHLILRSWDFSKTHALVRAAALDFSCPSGVYMEIDIDARNLL
ncbi:MAG: primosomal protein N', partial [Spirochaetales bacterium]